MTSCTWVNRKTRCQGSMCYVDVTMKMLLLNLWHDLTGLDQFPFLTECCTSECYTHTSPDFTSLGHNPTVQIDRKPLISRSKPEICSFCQKYLYLYGVCTCVYNLCLFVRVATTEEQAGRVRQHQGVVQGTTWTKRENAGRLSGPRCTPSLRWQSCDLTLWRPSMLGRCGSTDICFSQQAGLSSARPDPTLLPYSS